MAGYKGNKLIVPGGYDMKKLTVDGESIFGLMVELNLYEDIGTNIMTGDITFADSYNLLSNKPFKEGSIVEIEAKDMKGTEHPESGSIKVKMEVVKIINRKTVKQDSQIYTLVLASGGWSSNVMNRVSKSFNQEKYSDMAQTIFDDYLKVGDAIGDGLDGGSLETDDSDGMYNVVIPNWKPLTALNWLAARSKKGKACNFLFWQDIDGYNFRAVDSLMKEDPVAKYYHQTQNTSDEQNTYFNIEEINFKDTGDVLFHAMGGMFGNHLIEIDFTRKIMTDYSSEGKSGGMIEQEDEFTYEDSFGSIEHADSNGTPLFEESSKFSKASRRTLLGKHSYAHDDMEDYKQDEWFRERISQRASLDYSGLHMWAMGSFSRKVGQKIELMYHSPETGPDKADVRVAKNYLIKAIRRKFDQTQFVMAIDLIKDDIPKK